MQLLLDPQKGFMQKTSSIIFLPQLRKLNTISFVLEVLRYWFSAAGLNCAVSFRYSSSALIFHQSPVWLSQVCRIAEKQLERRSAPCRTRTIVFLTKRKILVYTLQSNRDHNIGAYFIGIKVSSPADTFGLVCRDFNHSHCWVHLQPIQALKKVSD